MLWAMLPLPEIKAMMMVMMMMIQSIHLNFVPRRMKMHYNSTFVKKIEIFHRGGHPIPRSTHFDVLSLRSP